MAISILTENMINLKISLYDQFKFKAVRSGKIRPQAKIHNFPLRIAILLLKGLFKRKEIIFYKKNFKNRKIMYLTNFIFK